MSVSLPSVPKGTTNTTTLANLFSGWTYKGSVTCGNSVSNLEPGIYVFYEYQVPTGYEVLLNGDNVVLYTAVITGGLNVTVNGIPGSVSVGGYTVTTNFPSTDGSDVTIQARDPKMAPMYVKKAVSHGNLPDANVGNWSVTLNLYESETATEVYASATITNDEGTAVSFKRNGSDAFFSVGKTYYLSEAVIQTNGTYADADHFKLISVKIGTQTITLPQGKTRYPIAVNTSDGFTIDVTNQYLYGRVLFWKVDNRLNAIGGAKFDRVEYSTDNGQTWTEMTSGASVTSSGNPPVYTATFPLVRPEGTIYRIYETDPPAGYVIHPNPDRTYIQVTLSAEHNYENLTEQSLEAYSWADHQYVINPAGDGITITKYNNVHGADSIGKVGANDATFALYHRTSAAGVEPETWEYLTEQKTNASGVVNFADQQHPNGYLLTPGETYAIAEISFESSKFNGFESIYKDGVKLDTVPFTFGGKTYQAYKFTNNADGTSFAFDAYNYPYYKPVIRKLDVGQYPDTPEPAQPIMDFKIIELPADFDLTTINATKAAELAAVTQKTDSSIPRLAFDGTTSTVVTVDGVTGVEGTVTGTTLTWQTNNLANRWDPAKNYLLVETKVAALNTTYDTLVKDDPGNRVEWFKLIPANVDPTDIDAFTLKNINSVADVTVEKTVIPKAEEGYGLDSSVVNNEVESLLFGNRKVAYTITPDVTGKNQMLTSFFVEEKGLTASPDNAVIDWTVDKILVGRAQQKDGHSIRAELYFYGADGNQIGAVKKLDDVTVVPADNTDPENPVPAVTDPVTFLDIPSGAKTFKIYYFSDYIENLSNDDEYVLGEEFRVEPTIVFMTVLQTIDGDGTVEGAAVEVRNFTNTAYTELHYPKWDDVGSASADKKEHDTATAVVNVKSFELPSASIEKNAVLANNAQAPAITDTVITYKLTVKNTSPAGSGRILKNPVVVDILPTGVKFKSETQYKPTTDPATFTISTTPVTGKVEQHITGHEDEADAETAVVFQLTGDLAPQEEVEITFYAQITTNAVAYDNPVDPNANPQPPVTIRNDAYLSSTATGKHTVDNPFGYPFALGKDASGYVFGDTIQNLAADDPASAIHEKGVRGWLADHGYGNPNWTSDYHEVAVVRENFLTIMKGVKGDQDPAFHDTGLGVASRTTRYEDDSNPPPSPLPANWSERQGTVEWRLTINNGDQQNATGLVIGDVIPKKGDNSLTRNSQWDVVFNEILSVAANAEDVSENMYTMWYYTGTIGQAEQALQSAMPAARGWTESAHGENWISQATLDSSPGDYDTIEEREVITAFIMVLDQSIILYPSHNLVITFKSITKDIVNDEDFDGENGVAYKNAVNDFYIYYDQYTIPTPSKPVSVTLQDQKVQVEGDVWIDEDWDAEQQYTGNRRTYSNYSIIQTFSDSFIFEILDKRKDSTGYHSEEDVHGLNADPGYGESIRHFTFKQLGAALCVRPEQLYTGTDGGANADGGLNYHALKGTDPFNYSIRAKIKNTAGGLMLTADKLSGIFELTDRGTGHYMSDDPVSELNATAANSLDSNFSSVNGSLMEYDCFPFYIRYSTKNDQSKDIGFRMYRGLDILKVAQDNPNLALKDVEFTVYGPFEEGAGTAAGGTVATFRLVDGVYIYDESGTETKLKTDENGRISIRGLNWWKEYVIKETKAASGYDPTGAVFTATDRPENGWTSETKNGSTFTPVENYDEIEELGDGAFRLKIPGMERTNPIHQVKIENPRRVPVQLSVEKILKTIDTSKYTFQFDLSLTDVTPATTKALNANLFGAGYAPKVLQTKALELQVTEGGQDVERVSFEPIDVNGEGVYTFTITERDTVEGFWGKYDAYLVRTVTVTVTWNEDTKKLECSYDYSAAHETHVLEGTTYVQFTNKYEPAPVYQEIPVVKEMDGDPLPADVQWTFNFLLTGVGNAPMPNGDGNKTYVFVDKEHPNPSSVFGNIKFVLPGTYEYKVTEVVPEELQGIYKLIGFDKLTEYTVTIVVVNDIVNGVPQLDANGNIKLKIESYTVTKGGNAVTDNAIVFTNTYTPTNVPIIIPVEKTISGTTTPKSRPSPSRSAALRMRTTRCLRCPPREKKCARSPSRIWERGTLSAISSGRSCSQAPEPTSTTLPRLRERTQIPTILTRATSGW